MGIYTIINLANKILMRIALFIYFILLSCEQKKSESTNHLSVLNTKSDTVVKISIEKVGKLNFRKSYSGSNPDTEESNSWGYNNYDTLLLRKFQKLGLIDDAYNLILNKFWSFKKADLDSLSTEFEIIDSLQRKLFCKLIWKEGPAKSRLIISDSKFSNSIGIEGSYYMEGIKFMLLDIIPGGYKEIVILNEWYISNGDNSDIIIYEVKYN
jgi:hypothetical protein